jgi:hypothetical protein
VRHQIQNHKAFQKILVAGWNQFSKIVGSVVGFGTQKNFPISHAFPGCGARHIYIFGIFQRPAMNRYMYFPAGLVAVASRKHWRCRVHACLQNGSWWRQDGFSAFGGGRVA